MGRDEEFGSESFNEFLSVLGEKIKLRGWERFRGGLDVKGKRSPVRNSLAERASNNPDRVRHSDSFCCLRD